MSNLQSRKANTAARKQAQAKGDTRYIGTPCSKPGHGSLRQSYNGICCQCHKEQSKEYARRDRAELKHLREIVGATLDNQPST